MNLLDVPRGAGIRMACFGEQNTYSLLRSRRVGIATLQCVLRSPDGQEVRIDLHPYMEVTVA